MSALKKFVSLKQSCLEVTEGLEQLRLLENNIPIQIVETGSYRLHLELELVNDAVAADRAIGFRFTPAEVMPLESGDTFYVEPQAVAAGRA